MSTRGERGVSLVIADDHVVVGESLVGCLAPHYNVLGLISELKDLEPFILTFAPVIAVVDLVFGSVSALPTIERLASTHDIVTRFLVLSAHESRAFAEAAIAAGALGYIYKGCNVGELRAAIDAAAHGNTPPASAGGLFSTNVQNLGGCCTVGGIDLTFRQAELLCLLLEGCNRHAAAASLGITPRGVDYHTQSLKIRTGLHERTHLIAWAIEHHAELLEIRNWHAANSTQKDGMRNTL